MEMATIEIPPNSGIARLKLEYSLKTIRFFQDTQFPRPIVGLEIPKVWQPPPMIISGSLLLISLGNYPTLYLDAVFISFGFSLLVPF